MVSQKGGRDQWIRYQPPSSFYSSNPRHPLPNSPGANTYIYYIYLDLISRTHSILLSRIPILSKGDVKSMVDITKLWAFISAPIIAGSKSIVEAQLDGIMGEDLVGMSVQGLPNEPFVVFKFEGTGLDQKLNTIHEHLAPFKPLYAINEDLPFVELKIPVITIP